MMRSIALALTLSAVAAAPALAEGWTLQTLGTMPSVEACMDKARIAVNRYIFDNGGGETAADSWSVYGFDLEPEAVDAVIMCPTGGGDYINAILVLHSEGTDRSIVADRIKSIWEE